MVPRRIWTLWNQGIENAPPVVQACVETWARWNPDWEVQVLTADTLSQWVDPVLTQPRAGSQLPYRLSELARLSLLERHGGVWVDATCFCMKPLDEWLPSVVGPSGFFAFRRPARERVVASWFLASDANGYIVRRMWRELSAYYLGHTFRKSRAQFGPDGPLDRVLNHSIRTTEFWFWPPLPQLRISPYFAFHYLFAKLARTDKRFHETWKLTPAFEANGPHSPHSILQNGYGEPPTEEIVQDLERRTVPVYKLDWRVDPDELPASSTLKALLATTS